MSLLLLIRLQPIHDNVKTQPDHVHKVPIPGGAFEREMVVRSEVPLQHTEQYHRQHDCTDGHMEAMEAGQQEESRAVNTGSQLQVEVMIRFHVFIRLKTHEG